MVNRLLTYYRWIRSPGNVPTANGRRRNASIPLVTRSLVCVCMICRTIRAPGNSISFRSFCRGATKFLPFGNYVPGKLSGRSWSSEGMGWNLTRNVWVNWFVYSIIQGRRKLLFNYYDSFSEWSKLCVFLGRTLRQFWYLFFKGFYIIFCYISVNEGGRSIYYHLRWCYLLYILFMNLKNRVFKCHSNCFSQWNI